jgi:HK97 family phage portal protein
LAETSIALYENARATYAELYRTQPELRSAIDFLARNVAQLPLHAFVRVSDTERQRLTGVPLTATLERPDTAMTRSRWTDSLVKDLAIYDAAYFVKVRGENGRLALVRVSPASIELLGENYLVPTGYRVRGTHGTVDFTRDQVIDIHGYNPDDARRGLSPIETLRRVLAEQAAAGRYRENFWSNSARMGGVIERPTAAPSWSNEARARFRADFEAGYTGASSSGKTVVLEEGMTYRPISYSARDAQYLESFQLSREIVATAYGIPVGLLGLGATTYASLTEQHRQLYADCLAPWLTRIQEELEAQLLPEFDVGEDTYLEYNLSAKLSGSFAEQASVLMSSTGAPYLTRNEARARLNLPPMDGADELVVPLNVLVGGQAAPSDSVSDERILEGMRSDEPATKSSAEPDNVKALRQGRILRERREAAKEFEGTIVESLDRQNRSVISKLGAKKKSRVKAVAADVFDVERFTEELAADLRPAFRRLARRMASTVGEWDPENAADYLDAFAKGTAEEFTSSTFDRLDAVLDKTDDESLPAAIDSLFGEITVGTAVTMSLSLATSIGEFSRREAAEAADIGRKTWVVTSRDPRGTHAALNGQTVGRRDAFSNGAQFPGDPALPAEEKANCQCLVDWGV